MRQAALILFALYLAYDLYSLILVFKWTGGDTTIDVSLSRTLFFYSSNIVFFLTALLGYLGIYLQKRKAIYLIALAPIFGLLVAIAYCLFTGVSFKMAFPYLFSEVLWAGIPTSLFVLAYQVCQRPK